MRSKVALVGVAVLMGLVGGACSKEKTSDKTDSMEMKSSTNEVKMENDTSMNHDESMEHENDHQHDNDDN